MFSSSGIRVGNTSCSLVVMWWLKPPKKQARKPSGLKSVQIKWTFEALRLGTWQSHQSSGQIMWLCCCANDMDVDKCANIKSTTGCAVCVRYFYIYTKRWKTTSICGTSVWRNLPVTIDHILLWITDFVIYQDNFLPKKIKDGMEKTHAASNIFT